MDWTIVMVMAIGAVVRIRTVAIRHRPALLIAEAERHWVRQGNPPTTDKFLTLGSWEPISYAALRQKLLSKVRPESRNVDETPPDG